MLDAVDNVIPLNLATTSQEHKKSLADRFIEAQPSQRILMAIADLEAAEQSPGYSIDMDTWHAPDAGSATCAVCLAGAVLASRHTIRPHQIYVGPFYADAPNEFSANANWDRVFTSLDELRLGFVDGFLIDDGRVPPQAIEDFIADHGPEEPSDPFPGHVPYDRSPEAFKGWARDVAAKLAAAGF